jgi:predicted dehydrogenase
MRMRSLVASGAGVAVAVADVDRMAAFEAAGIGSGCQVCSGLDELLALDLDGVVIATPSAMHAEQAIAVLEAGMAVFCQKPLGRSASEVQRVLDAARAADRRLDVDLSYRHTATARRMRSELMAEAIGEPYALELVFHNAYGPDKPWFTDRRQSGGGCLIDLGTHLLDLALWLTGGSSAEVSGATLRRRGRPVEPGDVEDFAVAALELGGPGVTARLACSWFMPAGAECELQCTVIGTGGALSLRNVGGSFYDFRLERRTGTAAEVLVEPPDDWGGRALIEWARGLERGFDAATAGEHLALARAIDAIYLAGGAPCEC